MRVKQCNVDAVLDCLNRVKVRCTYSTVAEAALGRRTFRRQVRNFLGEKCWRESWVVHGHTGKPVEYTEEEMHPDLYRTDKIINSCDELFEHCPGLRSKLRKIQ